MTTVDRGTGPQLLLHSMVRGGYLHLGSDGDGSFTSYGYYASSLYSFDDPTQFLQVTAAGDRNEDGYQDLVAVNRQSGELLLLEGDMYGNARYKTRLAAAGTAHRLPATVYDHTYDYDQDYTSDLYAVRSAEPTDLSRYPGTGTGTFGPRRDHEYLIDGITLIETAGDMNGDWLPDLLIRYDDGLLSTHAGGNDWDQGGGITDVGTGWNKMSAILGGQDYTGDGKPDIVAREAATGYLWLYPGTGEGGVGSRTRIGTGWNAMRELTAVGDLDHDGHADLLAARTSDGCLYLYRGNGKGGFSGTVKVGCGWNKMNALAAIGDADRDGHVDLLARRAADGALILYKGNGAGGFPSSKSVGTGWNSIKFIA
ncbi:FG-GAP repeat domain-containing protein [Glycomyces mayteni]|uniref:FG-GAP repeat domain-containing protein n=1 Tax=Glycomyces mayteni TaxID=543887 RepID=A0ABW2DA71_9ACTN|nr:hypothetical protein GCM10025732_10920 [Glycomyces mayteni]